eukprot:s534_g38.t1
MISNAWKWGSAAPAQSDRLPVRPAPSQGLNTMFRGGGRGAARTTAHKREENGEAALLDALASLLRDYKPEAPDKHPQHQASKSKPSRQQASADATQEGQSSPENKPDKSEQKLLQSLERIIAWAQREPGSLLQRLTSLVHTASQQHSKRNKSQNWQDQKKRQNQRSAAQEPPRKKVKHDPSSEPKGKGAAAKGDKPASQQRPNDTTWADVVKNKHNQAPDKGKGQGSNRKNSAPAQPKGLSKHKPKSLKESQWALLESAWAKGALMPFVKVKEKLEAGQSPDGLACVCQTLLQVQDMQRLATLHKLTEKGFALILTPDKTKAGESNLMYLPTYEKGRVSIRQFCVFPLPKTLPAMPTQKARATEVSAEKAPLAVFRLTIPKVMVTRDLWETLKCSPRNMVNKTFGDKTVRSTYGWQEVKFANKKQPEPEILLQGFLRCPEKSVDHVLMLSGKDGIFADRLSHERSPRPNVWWIPRKESEDMISYFTRATAEAKKENTSICFRKGGSTCLGLRLQANKSIPQLHAWTLHGAPRHWFGQDVLQCLFDAGCSEAAIIRPPGKQKAWLVKAIVPDENSLGVMAIHAGSQVMYLNRVINKQRRSTEVMSVIRSKLSAKSTQVSPDALIQKAAAPKPERPRSRSPNKEKESNDATAKDSSKTAPKAKSRENGVFARIADRVTSVECGGEGNCGYNCLAAGLALDKGETFDHFKDLLHTRGKTMRNDIYKHLDKHASEYRPFFTPAAPNEGIDAGPSPTTWSEYLECTLREGRWIDGISLKAASKRFGIQIIVVPLEGEAKDEPMSFGETRSSREPIVLLLNDQQGHYTLAQLKEGRQWPKEWIQAPLACEPRESARSQASQWRAQSTPKTVKSKSKAPTAKEPSRHAWRCAATPSATAKSDWRHRPASSRPALTRADPEAGSQEVRTGISEQFVWTCDLCQQIFRYTNKRSLSCARRRHIAKAHKSKKKAVHRCFPRRNECLEPIAEASNEIPLDQRAWSCPKCNKGLASMRPFLLKKSRDAHVMKCYGYTKAKFRKLGYKNPIWKAHQKQLSKSNAAKKVALTDNAIQLYNEKKQARAFRIPPEFCTNANGFSCGVCTGTFHSFALLEKHACPGCKGRAAILSSPGRKKTWMRCRQAQNAQAGITFFIKSWNITFDEIDLLEKRLQNCSNLPSLQESSWIRDLCADGDIEPNPGPHSQHPCRSLRGVMANTNGRENTWALAREIITARTQLCVVAEHRMLEQDQASLGDFNHEPDLAQRWTNLSEYGAVRAAQDSEGNFLPTRWQGNRCIDWIWTSHPHMLGGLSMSDFSLSDHLVVNFNLSYDQAFVCSFKQVPTRKLLQPDAIPKPAWVAALTNAWNCVNVPPPPTTTEEEWQEFCHSAEQAHHAALQTCGQDTHRFSRAFFRPKGSDMQTQACSAKTFRLKHNCGFRELKLRKLFGRLKECARQKRKGAKPAAAWKHITADELYQQAARQKGSAGGPDGLTGDEVAAWPPKAWQILAELLERWISRSDIPSVWSSVRQVHLQKPEAQLRSNDMAIQAKDMRPISVQCVLWRIIASSWARRASTRDWVKTWVHRSACGGLPGKGVAEAIDLLWQEFEKPGRNSNILASLDFQKCFDTVDPQLGVLCLEHLG